VCVCGVCEREREDVCVCVCVCVYLLRQTFVERVRFTVLVFDIYATLVFFFFFVHIRCIV